jgi:transcriptional regulator with XRE-family HTH domain
MPLSAEDRKAKVKARKGLQRSIARRLKVSETHVSLVVAGQRDASDRVKKEIARRLKLPVEEVFPAENHAAVGQG